MLNKNGSLKEVNWTNIELRYGREHFDEQLRTASLVGFVNWTMLPHMSAIWEAIQQQLSPLQNVPKRKIFFDLADPQKRADKDILHALDLIVRFGKHFDVILGLNEKESFEIGRVLGLNINDRSKSGLIKLAQEINQRIPVETLVVHPVAYALAVSGERCTIVDGPFITVPKITTGAGDHFNAGFCLGKLLGFDDELSLLCGVGTSGYYVRTAASPNLEELTDFIASKFEYVSS